MKTRSGFGWIEFIVGVLMTALGIFTFTRPDGAVTGLVVVYGVAAIVTGVCDIVFYARLERYLTFGPVLALVTGILSVMAGFMLIIYPNAGTWIMALLFPIWFIAHCISALARLNVVRACAGAACFWFSLVVNVIGLIFGLMMLFRPGVSVFTIGFIIGAYLVALGIDSIAIAFSKTGER